MKKEDLKIIDEFIPDWILGVNNSMLLDSGQEVCSLTVQYHNKTIRAYVMAVGDVVVNFREDGRYKAASQFPQELLDYFAGKRPDLEDDVVVGNNNWFELIFDDKPNIGYIVDDFENFATIEDIRKWMLDSIGDYLNGEYH